MIGGGGDGGGGDGDDDDDDDDDGDGGDDGDDGEGEMSKYALIERSFDNPPAESRSSDLRNFYLVYGFQKC